MAIVINGSGTVTGLAVGGLPDGTVDAGTLATDSVTEAKIATDSVTTTKIPAALENTFVSGRKNLFINGGFDVWQRGTSLAGATSYLADRWYNSTTETQTRQTFTVGQTDVPHNPTYYHRGSSGSTEWYGLKQKVENVAITAGREVTLSYWAKGSSAFTNAPYRGQNFGSGGSSEVNAALSTASITTSWARYTHTFTLPSISGKTVGAGNYMQISIMRANVNNITIDLANCQLEFGDTATDFEQRSYGEELALCQRYYQAVEGAGAFEFDGLYASGGGNGLGINFPLPVEMRASPTLTHSWNDTNNIASQSITASSKGLFVGGTTSGGGRTAMNKTGSGYVRLNAEL